MSPAEQQTPRTCRRLPVTATKAEKKQRHVEKMLRKKLINEILGPGFYPSHLWGRFG